MGIVYPRAFYTKDGFLQKDNPGCGRGYLEKLRELGIYFPSSLQKEEKKRFHTMIILT
jgi:hypothetical protein